MFVVYEEKSTPGIFQYHFVWKYPLLRDSTIFTIPMVQFSTTMINFLGNYTTWLYGILKAILNLFKTLFSNVLSKSFTCCCAWNEACPNSRLSNSSTFFLHNVGLYFVKLSPLAYLQVILHVQEYQLPL